MLSLLKVFQHSQIAHHGLKAAASATGMVLLLLEMSSDQFADKFPMQGCSVENMGRCTSFFLLLNLSSKGDCPPLFCELMQLCLTSMDFGEVNRSCYLMLFFVSFCCTGLWGTSSTIHKKILSQSIFKLERRGRWQLQLRLHLVPASLLP